VCDLCGGEPKCVTACTEGAIFFDPGAFGEISLREFKKPAKGLSPEEKRVRFALSSSQAMREKWVLARRA
jgi:hypothetical protein